MASAFHYLHPGNLPSTRAELLDFARHFDSVSDRLLANGQISNAERLAHLAYEARCRAELSA